MNLNSARLVCCFFFLLISVLCHSQAGKVEDGIIKTLDGKGRLNKAEIDKFIQTQMDTLNIVGLSFALINDEQVVYSKSFGMKDKEKGEKVDGNTLFEAASMTKPLFAYSVLKLARKGILNLDTPLYKYYAYQDLTQDDRYKKITARMVLSHTSGLPNWRHEKFQELTIDTEPGSKFEYSGEAYGYLGLVIQHLTGKNLKDVIHEEVFAPLGMKHSYMVWNDSVAAYKAMGYEKATPTKVFKPLRPHPAGTLHTEAEDYARFGIELMKEDKEENSIFRQMSTPQILGKAPTEGDPNSGIWVGLGIFIEKTPYGTKYQHGGNNGDFMGNFQFFKQQRSGYVFFMNCDKMPPFLENLNKFLSGSANTTPMINDSKGKKD